MKNAIYQVGSAIRGLFREKINIVIMIQLLSFVFFTWLILTAFFELCNGQYHFYKNTSKSLEHIYNKDLDTTDKKYVIFDDYNGDIKRELTTEQELVRKMNKKWHLRDLRKLGK